MRRRLNLNKFILIISLLISHLCTSQNLVPNPSFEINWECPTGWYFSVSNWYRVQNHQGTADYMHMCSTNSTLVIPGPIGTQLPLDGSAYIGFFVSNQVSSEAREYFQVQLISPLVANQLYTVSFFVSMADFSYAATNNIGAVLTNLPLSGTNNIDHISIIPQVYTTSVISDKTNWVEISGTFQAVGGERYLTIGNFFSDEQTTTVNLDPIQPQWSYYFVDSVSVTSSSLGQPEQSIVNNSVFPNPFNSILNITIPDHQSIKEIQIYSFMGLVKLFKENRQSLDLSDLASGLYNVVILTSDDKRYVSRVIKK